MIASSAVIKKTARALLKGKWLRYAAVAMIAVLLTLSCAMISEMFLYVSSLRFMYTVLLIAQGVLLLAPLYLGVLRVFWRMYMGVEDSPVAVFYYFTEQSKYLRAMGLVFRYGARILGCGILCLAPAIITGVLSYNGFYKFLGIDMPGFASNFSIVSDVLQVIGITITVFVAMRWYLAPFFLVADEDMDPAEAIHMSYVISKCTYVDVVSLAFCCLHLLFFSALIMPLMVTAPYLINIYLVHARFATNKYNSTVEQFRNDSIPTYAVG